MGLLTAMLNHADRVFPAFLAAHCVPAIVPLLLLPEECLQANALEAMWILTREAPRLVVPQGVLRARRPGLVATEEEQLMGP